MKSKRLLSVLTLLLFWATCGFAGEPMQHRLQDPGSVDAIVDAYVVDGVLPFVYVRLEDRDGRVIYEHAAVNDKILGDLPINGSSWIRIWSMSKIVTISVVMDLVEDGILKLSDPVTRYIPEFQELEVALAADGSDLSLLQGEAKKTACPLTMQPVKYQMTVLDLLNHRGGFYYQTTGIDCLDARMKAADLPAAADGDELIERMARLPLINQPGTTSFYGTGTTVLGLVAQRATGKTLDQLVRERVTGPLNIDGLQYGLPDGARLPPRVSGRDGYLREARSGELDIFGSTLPGYEPGSRLFLGGEGMLATADGYADFARMLLRRGELNGHRLLEEETVAQLSAPHTQLDSPYGHNGYNLWVANGKQADGSDGPGPLWIGGGYEGTHFWIDPEREFVGVIMSQIFWVSEQGRGRNDAIREAVYEQLRFPADGR